MQTTGYPLRSPNVTRPRSDYELDAESEDTGKLVLVVDDSHMICQIVKFSLAKYGINTRPFHSGVDALTALKEGVVPIPDLVLLDIGMPHMRGYAVASLLRSRGEFRSVPIVMLSGHDGLIDRWRALRVGATDFISKPFDEDDLVRKVCALLNLEVVLDDPVQSE
jgi:twitching motility two-component system response regulator PilG